ncbi:hypothetical protein NK718_20395 [Alsobacter sp. SYSU M60028]|uniref:Preprotein translocase subunit SecE n=1 Tax=Alsobacter ponti TaxID=2962936 RepID=A0ABT1LHG1_9HYPH|nr:hypothetical protein [Alsobacter ponti]MCP8940894.1 hypothetical protein [Alsobacter ponti]
MKRRGSPATGPVMTPPARPVFARPRKVEHAGGAIALPSWMGRLAQSWAWQPPAERAATVAAAFLVVVAIGMGVYGFASHTGAKVLGHIF